MKKAVAPLFLVCIFFAAMPLVAEDTAQKHGLMTVDSAWMKAMLANDPAACAALYTDDAVLVLPGTGAIAGRKAIEQAYAGWMSQMRVTDVSIFDGRYESSGPVSSGWGRWKVTSAPKAGGAPVTETGTWCAVALEKDGVWKYASDHASPDPAAAPK
jgi:uncharacterized protein (TIGR02246 family)